MIRYDDWWIPLQASLQEYLSVPVIQAETTGKQPNFDFVSIKQTTSSDETTRPFRVDTAPGEYEIHTPSQMVLSITVHSNRIENATDLAQMIRLYFNGIGYQYLSDNNFVVRELSPITNRDTFITIEYERRMGLDVTIAYTDVDKITDQDYIEVLYPVDLVAYNDVEEVDREDDLQIPFKTN